MKINNDLLKNTKLNLILKVFNSAASESTASPIEISYIDLEELLKQFVQNTTAESSQLKKEKTLDCSHLAIFVRKFKIGPDTFVLPVSMFTSANADVNSQMGLVFNQSEGIQEFCEKSNLNWNSFKQTCSEQDGNASIKMEIPEIDFWAGGFIIESTTFSNIDAVKMFDIFIEMYQGIYKDIKNKNFNVQKQLGDEDESFTFN